MITSNGQFSPHSCDGVRGRLICGLEINDEGIGNMPEPYRSIAQQACSMPGGDRRTAIQKAGRERPGRQVRRCLSEGSTHLQGSRVQD